MTRGSLSRARIKILPVRQINVGRVINYGRAAKYSMGITRLTRLECGIEIHSRTRGIEQPP